MSCAYSYFFSQFSGKLNSDIKQALTLTVVIKTNVLSSEYRVYTCDW